MEIHHATVRARHDVTPRMIRLTLTAPGIAGRITRPAQDVHVLLGDGPRPVKRRYTVRHARPGAGEIDVEVFLHAGGGPGSRWAASARPGAAVGLRGPKGKLELRPADWHLFVGDEAALPTIAALTEALGPAATTIVLAEIGETADRIPLAATHVKWITRDGTPPGTPHLLNAAFDRFAVPAGQGRAYLLGESRTMKVLRERLPELPITPERTFVKGYWKAGRSPSAAR